VTGTVDGWKVLLGNATLMEESGIDIRSLGATAAEQRREGQTVMFLAVDGKPASTIGAADPIKASTEETIRLLHADGGSSC
jgi:Cu+-exporting ATPase